MNYLLTHLIYNYNDMGLILSNALLNKFPFVSFSSIDFLSSYILFVFLKLFGPVLGASLLMILYVFINIFCSYYLFKRLLNHHFLSGAFGLLYAFSVYFLFRIISFTPNLYPIFIFPLTLYLLLKNIKPLFLGVVSFLFLCLSSYYAFFSIIIICFWYLFHRKFQYIFVFMLPLLFGILLFFSPYLIKNTQLSNYSSTPQENQVYRPIEDWYNFSFRPWYFFIPPPSSLYFGDFSKTIYEKISSTNYYLSKNYVEDEMAGSYMGWHFLLGMTFVLGLLILNKFKHIKFKQFANIYENKKFIFKSFLLIFLILLISGPPSFTIGGIQFYTPTYILYYIVPVFRSLVRWAAVIYLLVLVINYFLVIDIYNLLKTKFQKALFIIFFISLNYFIFAIKLPIININNPPQEISFIKNISEKQFKYAVYPVGDYYSTFWVLYHKKTLINPTGYTDKITNFNSNKFSEELITLDGIAKLKEQNVSYLVLYINKLDESFMKKVQKLNFSITTPINIKSFFITNFGKVIYEEGDVLIFSSL